MPNRPIMDHFFSSQRPLFAMSPRVWNPPTDIYESNNMTYIKIEVAGLDEERLEIINEGSVLTVRGQRTKDSHPEGVHYQLMEVPYGHFERRFRFRYSLEKAKIEAQYQHGFLLIKVPHSKQGARKIDVEITKDPKSQS